MVYDVHDTGGKATPGSGIRSSKTNGGQGFHNDNAFNLPPDFVALFCLQTAKKGGVSGIVSFESVYNKLLEEHQGVLERLYQPFHFDRQMEHSPDEERLSFNPIFEVDGDALNVRFSPRLVEHGYQMRQEQIDKDARAAIDALCRTTEIDNLCKRFEFQRGQIQVVNNRRLAIVAPLSGIGMNPKSAAILFVSGSGNRADRFIRANWSEGEETTVPYEIIR